jgi:hypothetical protein
MTDGGGAPRSALFRSAEADGSILCDKQQMMPLYFQVTFELCSPAASLAPKQCDLDIFFPRRMRDASVLRLFPTTKARWCKPHGSATRFRRCE